MREGVMHATSSGKAPQELVRKENMPETGAFAGVKSRLEDENFLQLFVSAFTSPEAWDFIQVTKKNLHSHGKKCFCGYSCIVTHSSQ